MGEHSTDIGKTWREVSDVSIELLSSDLDMAMTMIDIAEHEPPGSEKRKRNQANARKAYDTAQHLKEHLTRSAEQETLLLDKLDRLKGALSQLGEQF